MSTREQGAASAAIETRDDLVRWIAAGEKPKADWRIGTEHEKFVFRTVTLKPVPYGGPDGIRALMEELIRRFGWVAINEGDNVIALKRPEGEKGGTISLEPGGQFELSGQPLETLHETAAETDEHLREVLRVGEDLAIGFLGIGFTPKWRLDEIPMMPKKRYKVMAHYMPTVGSRGLDMMFRTATIQVNLDFASEADMVKKLRVSLALQPVATALFASSPFTEGKPNGYQSMRSAVWLDTDKRRTGMLPFAFEDGMGYERYVDYALDVPMYFVYRDGNYIDVAGSSFRDFMALPAFWAGILYDEDALDQAWQLVRDWTEEEREALRVGVPKTGLLTPFRTETVRTLARQVLRISRAGLKNRRRINQRNQDETIYLAPLEKIAGNGQTVSDELLRRYSGEWQNNIDHIFEELAF
jgi:glutamate--cysteine ligase